MAGAVLVAAVDAVPTLEVQRQGGGGRVVVPLSTSQDGVVQASLEVRLWRGHWRGVVMHDFKYAIVVLDGRANTLVELFDRSDAAPYVNPVRSLVLPCVCAAAQALVAAVRPQIIYRATYLANPPPSTLVKHEMVTDTLVRLGFEVLDTGTDASSRRFWLMVKVEEV